MKRHKRKPRNSNFLLQFCYRLWNLSGNITLDQFGRPLTVAQGYLYFISHGKQYLYCASKEIFTENLMSQVNILKPICFRAVDKLRNSGIEGVCPGVCQGMRVREKRCYGGEGGMQSNLIKLGVT